MSVNVRYSDVPNKRVVPNKPAVTKWQILPTHIFAYCYLVPNKLELMDFFPTMNKRAAHLIGTSEYFQNGQTFKSSFK